MPRIQTVLGDIDPKDLGPTLVHEHTFLAWGGWQADPRIAFDREAQLLRLGTELRETRERFGLTGLVDAAPADLGRDIAFEQDMARISGAHVIAATGMYRSGWGFPRYWQTLSIEDLEDFFESEIAQGVGTTEVRCGVIKVASALVGMTDYEERAFRAAARVSRRLGVGIITHTDPGGWAIANVGLHQLEVMLEEGADPTRIMIGHAGGTHNLAYLLEIVRRGAAVGFDRIGSPNASVEEGYAALVGGLIAAGFVRQVLLSHDRVGTSPRRVPLNPLAPPPAGPTKTYSTIHREFLPRLRAGGVSETAIETMLIENTRNLLAF